MPSLIPGYEYDIFISYRHKDNLPKPGLGRHANDGWVTEFVANLKKELEGTFKEDISVYFDQNPYDGLLENHQVDDSLREKLKCLILIPIISQTYCDPKSFAWKHEFCAFNDLAKRDPLGRDIKIANGNVASRILPVRIHELDSEDKVLLENELGSMLRPIDFIYKKAGVNRPLKTNDGKSDNINHTYYHDQINKVANAVKEIISGLRKNSDTESVITKELPHNAKTNIPKRSKLKLIAAISAAAVLVTTLLTYSILPNDVSINKSVAVLAFKDLSEKKDQEWFSDGLAEEILNSLSRLPDLKVSARTSSFYFKDKDVPIPEIASKLGVEHIVEGSVRRIGNQLRITVQLIRADDGFHLWSKTFDESSEDLFNVQTEIAESIARLLLKEFSPESLKILTQDKPNNTEAYEYYLKGLYYHLNFYWKYGKEQDFKTAENMFLKSISLDSTFASAYADLADLYDTRSNYSRDYEHWWAVRDSVLQIGYRLNPNALSVIHMKGLAFLRTKGPLYDSALIYLLKAYTTDPSNDWYSISLGYFYEVQNMPAEAEKYYDESLVLDPLNIGYYDYCILSKFANSKMAESRKLIEKALELEDNIHIISYLTTITYLQDDLRKFGEQVKITAKKFPGDVQLNKLSGLLAASNGNKKEALSLTKGYPLFRMLVYRTFNMKKEAISQLDSLLQTDDHFLVSYTVLRDHKLHDFIREEDTFKTILEKQRLAYEKRVKRYKRIENR